MIKMIEAITTSGDGYWSDASCTVHTTGLKLAYVNEANSFGELRVYFDTDTWDINDDGLIYTDTGFLRTLRELLIHRGLVGSDVSYSEQGMQGANYVSLDVGEKFIASWNRYLIQVAVSA